MTTGNPSYDPNESANVVPNNGVESSTVHGEQSTGDTVKQKAGQVANQAQQVVSQATDQAQQQAKSQMATRKDQAVGSLSDVSQAVSQVSTQLRQNDHETLAQYADMAAQQVNRAASYLRERNINELLDDVQGMARRQPAVFIVGALALGVLGARFLKSSSPQSGSRSRSSGYRQGYSSSGYGPTGSYDPTGGYGAPTRDWREVPDNLRGSQRDQGASYGLGDPNAPGTDVRRLTH
jgi:hypothetical protein